MVVDLRKSVQFLMLYLRSHPVEIIEGILTVACSLLGYVFTPDFPDKNTFLTKEQTEVHSFHVPVLASVI